MHIYIANEAVNVPTEESLNITPEGLRPSRMYTFTGREAVWELALREDQVVCLGDYHRIRPDLKTKTNLHTEQVEWPGKEGFMVD